MPGKQKFTLVAKSTFQMALKISLKGNTPLCASGWTSSSLLGVWSVIVLWALLQPYPTLCNWGPRDKTSRREKTQQLPGRVLKKTLGSKLHNAKPHLCGLIVYYYFSLTLLVLPACKDHHFKTWVLRLLITCLGCEEPLSSGGNLTGLLSLLVLWGVLIKAFSCLFLRPSPNTKLSVSLAPSKSKIPTSNLCSN